MIYRRGRVCWYRFKWSVKNSDGTRTQFLIQRSARTGNKRKAGEVQEEHRRALRLGQVHPLDPWPKVSAATPPSLRNFAERFKQYVSAHTKKGTPRFYGECLARLTEYPALADAVLCDISSEVVSKYAQYRLSVAENSVSTVNGDIRTLRRLLNLACEWGLIANVPKVHELPGDAGRERVISHKEESAYLANASPTLHDVAILAVDSGLRPNSELFPLEWADVMLQGTPEAPNGVMRVRQGKTSNAVRSVPLTPRAKEVLLCRKQRRTEGAKYVFPGPGRSGHIITVQHAHEHAMRTTGLEAFPFYCWRHTFGTRCAESGMDRFSLARLMGHSSPRVAERYYVHVTEPHVAAGFGKFLDYQARHAIASVSVFSGSVQ